MPELIGLVVFLGLVFFLLSVRESLGRIATAVEEIAARGRTSAPPAPAPAEPPSSA